MGGTVTLATRRSLAASGDPTLRVGEVLGDAVERRFVLEGRPPSSAMLSAPLDNWVLVHQDGAWAIRGRRIERRSSDGKVEFTFAPALPASLTGGSQPAETSEARLRQPKATDALRSPSGALLVILHKEGVEVWDGEKKLGAVRGKDPVVVLTQWAVGAANVARWGQQAGNALSP
jgi:hypothetical protein